MESIIQTAIVITICSLGLPANTCALLVILKSSIINISTGVYLAFLSISDSLVLLSQLLYMYTDFYHSNTWACKSLQMVLSSATAVSTIILVALTIDRGYVLLNPHKPKPTARGALKIATVCSIVSVLVYSVQLGIMSGLVFNPNATNHANENATSKLGTSCSILPPYKAYLQTVFLPLSLFVQRLLAPCLVVVCNVLIIRVLVTRSPELNSNVAHQQDKKGTKMLVVVSLSFVVLILPSGIYFVVVVLTFNDPTKAFGPDRLAYQIIIDFFLLNHSLNFLLYVLSGKKFREETQTVLRSLLTCVRNENAVGQN